MNYKDLGELRMTDEERKATEEKLLKHKTNQVLWIVSNCGVRERNIYANELKRSGVALDKFGRCGKPDPCKRNIYCTKAMFAKYKFYLAFENSHCEDYISEKTWKSFDGGMVPIVMGPSIQNYLKRLPPNSFLHVNNFTSPIELAEYIKYLDKNNEAYSKYHAWRKDYDAVFVNDHTFLWVCDICKKIHDPPRPAYDRLAQWWIPAIQCKK